MSKTLINYLIAQLHEIELGKPWLDEWFNKKIEPVDEAMAFESPLEGVHSIAENLSHLVEWRQEVLSRLQGNARSMEVTSPNNWRSNEALAVEGWPTLVERYRATQKDLIQFLSDKDDAFLEATNDASGLPNLYYVEGVIHHDLYHLGQIGLVSKLLSLKA